MEDNKQDFKFTFLIPPLFIIGLLGLIFYNLDNSKL
jgi:hypothetical protein